MGFDDAYGACASQIPSYDPDDRRVLTGQEYLRLALCCWGACLTESE